MKNLRQSNRLYKPSIVIEDLFDSLFKENTLSMSISKVIQQLVRLCVANYNETYFNDEQKIDNFIEENDSLIDDVVKILEFYADIYLVAFNRAQRYFSLKQFENIDLNNLNSSIITSNVIKKWVIGSFRSNLLLDESVREIIDSNEFGTGTARYIFWWRR